MLDLERETLGGGIHGGFVEGYTPSYAILFSKIGSEHALLGSDGFHGCLDLDKSLRCPWAEMMESPLDSRKRFTGVEPGEVQVGQIGVFKEMDRAERPGRKIVATRGDEQRVLEQLPQLYVIGHLVHILG